MQMMSFARNVLPLIIFGLCGACEPIPASRPVEFLSFHINPNAKSDFLDDLVSFSYQEGFELIGPKETLGTGIGYAHWHRPDSHLLMTRDSDQVFNISFHGAISIHSRTRAELIDLSDRYCNFFAQREYVVKVEDRKPVEPRLRARSGQECLPFESAP